MQDFKRGVGYRHENDYAVPRKLLPLLTKGLSQDEVAAILGPPDTGYDAEPAAGWDYTLFYGMYLGVNFDADGKLKEVHGPLLADEALADELAREIGD